MKHLIYVARRGRLPSLFAPVALAALCAAAFSPADRSVSFGKSTSQRHHDCDCHPERSAVTSCCPDDYCAKPLPQIPCAKKYTCPDDYCPKILPQLCLPCKKVCPDDYCPKILPPLRLPFCTPAHKCPPGKCDCH